jgi:hypothetical protein
MKRPTPEVELPSANQLRNDVFGCSVMKLLPALLVVGLLACGSSVAKAQILIGGSINNGNLDRTYAQEIVPGFFLPKPIIWINEGFRTISGPYEDEMSSEPWAGPAPTPVTTDGNLNPPHPEGHGGPDGGVFFKPFTGNPTVGAATGHLYQDNPATPGLIYLLTGWAGAEANALMGDAVFALEFLDAGNSVLAGSAQLSLWPTLTSPNGEPFNYKQYSLIATAPAGTVNVRARVSMIDAMANPLGGGQAFVVDDFELSVIPEPTTLALFGLGLAAFAIRRRS